MVETSAKLLMRGIKYILAGLLLLACLPPLLLAASDEALKLPRMVSLGASRVYLRVGPEKTYRAILEYRKETLPVEIFLEYDNWRKIRDHEGAEGWVHKSMLSGKRHVIFLKGQHALRGKPEESAPVEAYVQGDVIGKLGKYTKQWCQVELKGHKGWVKREAVWGLYPQEESSPKKCLLPFLPVFCR
jgi:SH3-like domain-containing protein